MCVNIIHSLRNQSQNIDYDHCKILGLVSVSCKNDQCSIMKNISLAQAIGQLYFHSNSVCLFQGAHTLMYNRTSLKSQRHYRSPVALFLLDGNMWLLGVHQLSVSFLEITHMPYLQITRYTIHMLQTQGEKCKGHFPRSFELLHLACILVLYE